MIVRIIKKPPASTKRVTIILITVKSCNALLLMLVTCIRRYGGYIKSTMRYKYLILYTSHDSPYFYVSNDVRIRGYFYVSNDGRIRGYFYVSNDVRIRGYFYVSNDVRIRGYFSKPRWSANKKVWETLTKLSDVESRRKVANTLPKSREAGLLPPRISLGYKISVRYFLRSQL